MMQVARLRANRPALKELVLEASQALARLDAERLEELALCCQVLNRDLNSDLNPDSSPSPPGRGKLKDIRSEARDAAPAMAAFAGVLDATRANLQVMQRLRAVRRGELEYSPWEKTDGHD